MQGHPIRTKNKKKKKLKCLNRSQGHRLTCWRPADAWFLTHAHPLQGRVTSLFGTSWMRAGLWAKASRERWECNEFLSSKFAFKEHTPLSGYVLWSHSQAAGKGMEGNGNFFSAIIHSFSENNFTVEAVTYKNPTSPTTHSYGDFVQEFQAGSKPSWACGWNNPAEQRLSRMMIK